MSHAPPPPFRPLPIRAFNALGRAAARLGVRGFSLDEDSLLGAARQQTGLADFGPDTFRAGLRVLLDSLERDARLNAFGRYYAQRQVLELLVSRRDWIERRFAPIDRVERDRVRVLVVLRALIARRAARMTSSWEATRALPADISASRRSASSTAQHVSSAMDPLDCCPMLSHKVCAKAILSASGSETAALVSSLVDMSAKLHVSPAGSTSS